ncbi:PadR family transcriptional regulator [uncultured Fretibacterium sp.]|uniref:PadR family transcriptional regulator n=1 Tax=uncultured Fretibacterium sp. TaxID=1678694 RepID=UPI00325F9D56
MGILERSGHRHLCAFILLLVAEEGGYGRRICQRLAEAFPGFKRDSSTVYRCLHTLVEEGALAFSWVLPERGEPQKEYRLTESGYADLEEWERDIAVRKRHFDTFLERCHALRAGGGRDVAKEETERRDTAARE